MVEIRATLQKLESRFSWFQLTHPRSAQGLQKTLEDQGIYGTTAENKKTGEIIGWTRAKTAKLFQDYRNGERTFYPATYTDQMTNTTSEKIGTEIKTVWADVDYTDPEGQRWVMYQELDERVIVIDRSGKQVSDMTYNRGETGDRSISGKVNVHDRRKNTHDKALRAEIGKELGLHSGEYVVEPDPERFVNEKLSLGFPNLMTRQDVALYSVHITQAGYRERYMETDDPIVVPDLETGLTTETTRIHHFRWRKAP